MIARILTCVLVCTLFFVTSAQDFSSQNVLAPLNTDPMDVKSKDLNQDGYMDILTVSEDDNHIVWFENIGNQEFSHHIITTDPKEPQDIYVIDLDKDSDLDVVCASEKDHHISWYENDGNENFNSHVISTNASGAASVFVKDINGDGHLDIVSGSLGKSKITWYENDGSENFTSHTLTSNVGGPNPLSVKASDMDNDNDVDVISTYSWKGIVLYRNDGNENFTKDTVSTTNGGPIEIGIADLNKNGYKDVVSINESSNKVVWYRNDGAQNYLPQTLVSNIISLQSMYLKDINGDSYTDILCSSNDEILSVKNDSSQNFTKDTVAKRYARDIHAADIDGDNDIDPVSIGNSSSIANYTAWHENKGNQNFVLHNISDYIWDAYDVHTADVNGNNKTDLIPINQSDSLGWYKNIGNQNFVYQEITFDNKILPLDINTAYLDADTSLDIILTNADKNELIWCENDGNQNFTTRIIDSSLTYRTKILTSDMNSDNKTDILISTQNFSSEDTVFWYENDGNKNFTRHMITDVMGNLRSIHTVDFDKDGDMDFTISSASLNGNIVWYENDGNQNFSAQVIADTSGTPSSSAFPIDLDQDNDVDIISATYNQSSARLVWYENDGNYNFTLDTISNKIKGRNDIESADIDLDGDLDIIVASRNGDEISWYENDGSENFQYHPITPRVLSPSGVDLADLDSDGDMDVFSSSFQDHKIAWYENLTLPDVIPPSALCQDTTIVLDSTFTGSINIPKETIDNGSFDNSSGLDSILISPNSFTLADTGNNTVLLTTIDNVGQKDSCQATVSIYIGYPKHNQVTNTNNLVKAASSPVSIYSNFNMVTITSHRYLGDTEIVIYDIYGRQVHSSDEYLVKHSQVDITLTDKLPGTYIVKVVGNNGSYTNKIILQ